jgi:hypothetical protein
LLLFSAQLLAIFSILMLAFGYLKAEPHDISARLFFVLALGIVCYLINGMSLPHIDQALRLTPGGWGVVLNLGANAIPGLFTLYCYHVSRTVIARPGRWWCCWWCSWCWII